MLIALADVLIEKKSIKLINLRQYVNLFKEILAFRNEFLVKHKDDKSDAGDGSTASPASASLHSTASTRVEVALLIQLCSGYAPTNLNMFSARIIADSFVLSSQ